MNRKAQFFNLFLVFGFLVFMAVSYWVLNTKVSEYSQDGVIGEKQLDLFNKYSDAEKSINYMKDSAVLSSQQSAYDFGMRGGYSKLNDEFYGFSLWSNKTHFYDLTNTKDEFNIIFKKNHNDLLGLYEADFKLREDNFKIELNKDVLKFTPVAPVTIKLGQGLFFDGSLDVFPVKGERVLKEDPDNMPKNKFMYNNDWGNDRGGGRQHEGTDIFAPLDTVIFASVGGKIERMGCNQWGGNRIGIRDNKDNYYYYAHLNEYGINLKENRIWKIGDEVNSGDIIGTVGDNVGCYSDCDSKKPGNTCGISGRTQPHLHFGIYQDKYNGKAVNSFNTLQEMLGGEVETTFGTAGLYSKLPFFDVPFDNSLLNYTQILESAKLVSKACSKKQDLNVKDDSSLYDCMFEQTNLIDWDLSEYCDDLDPLYKVKEQLDSCLASVDDSCDCEIKFEGELEFLRDDKKVLVGNPSLGEVLEVPDITNLGNSVRNIKEKFVVRKENNVLTNVNKVENECRVNDRTFKVCAKLDREVLASASELVDSELKEVTKFRNVSVNFAFYVNDSSPPPEIIIKDIRTGASRVLLSFERSAAPDVANYVVVYKPSADINSFKDSGLIKETPLLEKDATIINSLDFNGMLKNDGGWYYYPADDMFYKTQRVAISGIESGKLYNFAVVAIDDSGNYVESLPSRSAHISSS